MNYTEQVQRLQDMAGFALWISLLVVPAIAVVKARIPTLKGWATLACAFGVACLTVGALVYPKTVQSFIDCLLVGVMAATIAVGGDSYLFRIIAKVRGKVPEGAVEEVFSDREAATKPDLKV